MWESLVMKRITSILLALLLCSANWAAADNYRNGLEAYNKGEYSLAVTEWLQAAEQGVVNAQFNLGVMYEKELGVVQDYTASIKWYQKAAEQGDPNSQYTMGSKYEFGVGVIQNYKEAARWYNLAASQGHPAAQNSIGFMTEYEIGVPRDYDKAANWYKLAAHQGYPKAQHNLGFIYSNGTGVPQNYTLAHMWFNIIAPGNGFMPVVPHTAEQRDLIISKLTLEDLAQAEGLAMICVSTNYKDCGD